MSITCPNCNRTIGGQATEGGYRLRLGIVLYDPEGGRIHGPCPHCKEDISVASDVDIDPMIRPKATIIPGVRVRT